MQFGSRDGTNFKQDHCPTTPEAETPAAEVAETPIGVPMTQDSDPASKREKSKAIQPDVQSKLGEKLKEVYADVVNEPVPDRFTELLNKLAQSEKKKSDS